MEKKKTALIVGMAKSGVSSAKLLYNAGYHVIINDLKHDIEGLEEAPPTASWFSPPSYPYSVRLSRRQSPTA